MRTLSIIILSFFICSFASGQGCPASSLGQNPWSAYPVCGDFEQEQVPICLTNDLFVPGCTDGALYANKNPYWYKFTCYESGTLGFIIRPHGTQEDYDWQLYDVTGLDPDAVYTNHSIIVTGNWSGSYGNTGAQSNTPSSAIRVYTDIQCSSDPAANEPRFETMPPIIAGHNYLLLISHFTDNQSGYNLSFTGGTAVIIDPLLPHLLSASAPCDGTEIRIATNKRMKCDSLAADGSDFIVTTPSGATVSPVSASSLQCVLGFDMDTLSVFMPGPFAPGTYTISAKKGTDGNTLVDNCDRPIPEGETISFTVFPLLPTPFDSITPVKCAPQTLELVFKKKINCNSIDPAGSEFSVNGPYPVTISGVRTICDANDQTYKILLDLAAPMQVHGNFTVDLHAGIDGNTIIDECGKETPPTALPFVVKDTVNANFTFNITYSCEKDVVDYHHDGANQVNYWYWNFGTAPDNFSQNPVITYTNFEPKTTTLIVSNGVCRDTVSLPIIFDNYFKAEFEVTSLVCPEDKAVFKNNSIGRLVAWRWDIGNGNIITVKDPVPQSYTPLSASDYIAYPRLIITNDYGCKDTIQKPVNVIFSCYIAVPSAFTPNGDGLNDYLYPLKAYKSSNLSFSVFNRFGERLFYSNDWQAKWDGTYKGQPQNPGTYVWMLEYTNSDNGRRIKQKGTTILIR